MSQAGLFMQRLPQPYYQDELVTIYHGDSRDIAPLLGRFDHVVTDPPYGISKEYGETADDWRPSHLYWNMLADQVTTSLHMTVSNRHLKWWFEQLRDYAWEYLHTSVYWNDTRNGGNWNGQFAYAWEPLLSYKRKGTSFKLAKRMMSDVFAHAGHKETEHPAERCPGVWTSFVAHLPAGLILDPFLGSGTTLRACKDLGRAAVGIEREAHWCEVAANRCAQTSLFTAA